MSLFQTIADILESIFKHSSPEVQKKQLIRKMDAEMKEFTPLICANGMLQPNFGEAIYALYKNVTPLDNLFSVTVSSNNLPRQHRFEAQLIMTGYSPENQELLDMLTFEARKEEVIADYSVADRIYLRQRQRLEKIIKDLNSETFRQMDKDILCLRQFVDFCHYNYVPFLQLFDSNFEPNSPLYQPAYREVQISKAANLLEDMYYQMGDLKITNVISEAVLALARLRKNGDLSPTEEKSYISNLKKINYVINKVISPQKLKTIIRMAKLDPNYEPQVAVYTGSPRQEFATMYQQKFVADEQRIKSELQDEKITEEVSTLFSGASLEEVNPYNQQYNSLLQNDTSFSFQWILPLRILKTFLRFYISDSVKALINDIVIEGYFNNPTYKSSFSQVVYSVINAADELDAFERSFDAGQPNSIAVLESYVRDSKKDKDFYKRLEKLVITINDEAHNLLQTTVTSLNSFHKEMGELLEDAKKPSSEIITNLKVLMMSSRNRENTNMLELQFPNWKIFFEIMKNYVIINTGEMQS